MCVWARARAIDCQRILLVPFLLTMLSSLDQYDKLPLAGSISKSGCSVLYDVDTKTTAQASRSEIFDQIRVACSAFFMQPDVRCCFFTQDFAAEREHLDLSFVHCVVDAAVASERFVPRCRFVAGNLFKEYVTTSL